MTCHSFEAENMDSCGREAVALLRRMLAVTAWDRFLPETLEEAKRIVAEYDRALAGYNHQGQVHRS